MATEAFRVLFCGCTTDFHAGYVLTARELAGEPSVLVECCEQNEVASRIGGADMAVPFMTPVDAELLRQAPRLRYLLQYGVGLEGVDLQAARAAGVRVANIPSAGTGNAVSCAEHALFLALSLLRNSSGMTAAFQQRRLGTPLGVQLAGRSALLVGFGAIARALAPRLRAMDVLVSAVRRSAWAGPGEDSEVDALAARATLSGLHAALGAADIVFLTLTLNESSSQLADEAFLAAMRPGALLVNISRGGLVCHTSALAALRNGSLGGLATDVAWREPWDPDEELARHPRVVMTPHVAGVTDVSYAAMARIVAEEARRCAAGLPPGGRVSVK
jgi:phosphoglycerate dehydrogenase-like enzyme